MDLTNDIVESFICYTTEMWHNDYHSVTKWSMILRRLWRCDLNNILCDLQTNSKMNRRANTTTDILLIVLEQFYLLRFLRIIICLGPCVKFGNSRLRRDKIIYCDKKWFCFLCIVFKKNMLPDKLKLIQCTAIRCYNKTVQSL